MHDCIDLTDKSNANVYSGDGGLLGSLIEFMLLPQRSRKKNGEILEMPPGIATEG